MIDIKIAELVTNPYKTLGNWLKLVHETPNDIIRIAHKGNDFPLGSEVILIQILSEWFKRNNSPTWRTYIQEPSPKTNSIEGASKPKTDQITSQLQKIVESDWGYVLSSLMFWGTGKFEKANRSPIGLNLIFEKIDRQFKKFQAPISRSPESVIKGHSASLICIDPGNYKLPSLYHTVDGKLRSKIEFEQLIETVYSEFHNLKQHPKQKDYKNEDRKALIEDTSTVLYELFENTEKWGCRDHNGIRQLGARGIQLNEQTKPDVTHSDGPAKQFIESNPGTYFELSVFDTGLGLAQHRTKQRLSDLNLNEELKACKECFNANFHNGTGKGLKRLKDVIDRRKGYFQLRTGRLFLYYHGKESTKPQVTDLFDFHTNGQEISEFKAIAGTSYTILLPSKNRTK